MTQVLEVSVKPHSGCQKFSGRFGLDALRFVNSEIGRQLRLRGLNAWVVVPGTVRVGDAVCKVSPTRLDTRDKEGHADPNRP